MIPRRIHGATRTLGAPRSWTEKDGDCNHLAIADVQVDGGRQAMVSAWELTPAELAVLNAGGVLYLQVSGNQHPVVSIWVPDAKDQVTPSILMILYCPRCGLQHVDLPDAARGWDNPPHKSHLCGGCGCIWRPADVPTAGVQTIETRGSADDWPGALPPPPSEPSVPVEESAR